MVLFIIGSVSIGLFLGFSNNILQLDAPTPWQIGFQDGASPGFEGIVTLHDSIMFYLIWILVSVFWVLISLLSYFTSNKSTLVYKYLNHGILMCPFQIFIFFLYQFFNFTIINSNSNFNLNFKLKQTKLFLGRKFYSTKSSSNLQKTKRTTIPKAERASIEITNELKEILVGLILGDVNCQNQYLLGIQG